MAIVKFAPLTAADGLPEPIEHLYFEDRQQGICAGVRINKRGQQQISAYSGHEFGLVVQGEALVDGEQSGAIPVKAGQPYIVRQGSSLAWRRNTRLTTCFVRYTQSSANLSNETGISVFNPVELEAALEPQSESIGGGAQRDTFIFESDDECMAAGMWETTAFESTMQPFSIHEFAVVLEGEVTITESNDHSHHFATGDCFWVSKGTMCSWKSTGRFKKYYVTLAVI